LDINSSELIDVLRRSAIGNSQRQALPVMMLYHPIPNSLASDW